MRTEDRARIHAALGDAHRLAMVDALAHTDLTPGALAELVGLGTNLAAHHLGLLEEAGVVAKTRSEGDGRRRYVTLRHDVLSGLVDLASPPVHRVAFVCTHNSARSQFAAARWAQRTGAEAFSAGTAPADRIHPRAVAAARRYDLDLSGRRPGPYDSLPAVDTVISVCDRALEHGLPPHRTHLHWSVPDPAESADPSAFDVAFAEIDRRIARAMTDQPLAKRRVSDPKGATVR